MERQMKSSTRTEKGTTIVDVVGQIDLGSSPALRKTLLESLKGTQSVAINLSAVKYIDSSGIGELVTAFTTVRNVKGELKLLQLTKRVHDILQITRLFTVFDVQSEEDVALRSFH